MGGASSDAPFFSALGMAHMSRHSNNKRSDTVKITILQGSPRKKGNTAQIIAWMEEELGTLGHEVETVFMTGKDLNGCLACAKCKNVADDIGCVQKDDVIPILETMLASDVIVYASPLYFWGFSAQLKTVIDRTYSLYVNYHQPGHGTLLDGKRQALVLTGGGPYEDNAEATVTAYRRLQKPHLTVNKGELYIGGCSTPDKLGAETRNKAVAFARQIVAD